MTLQPAAKSTASCHSALALGSVVLFLIELSYRPPAKGGQYNGDEQLRPVSPHYFRVFRIPLLRGRGINETDAETRLAWS